MWQHILELFRAEYLAGLRPRTREKYRTVHDLFEQIIGPNKLRALTERTVTCSSRECVSANRPLPARSGLAPHTMKLPDCSQECPGLSRGAKATCSPADVPDNQNSRKETAAPAGRVFRANSWPRPRMNIGVPICCAAVRGPTPAMGTVGRMAVG